MQHGFSMEMEVFSNSGCAFAFYPLKADENSVVTEIAGSQTIGWLGLEHFRDRHEEMDSDPEFEQALALPEASRWHEGTTKEGERYAYLRYRLACKSFSSERFGFVRVVGLEIAFETTSSLNADADRMRGFFLSEEVFPEGDPRRTSQQPPSVYHNYGVGDEFDLPVKFSYGDDYDPSELEICVHVKFKKPDAVQPLDVDLVVDIGNTRTVAMLVKQSGLNGDPVKIGGIGECCCPVMLRLDNRDMAVRQRDYKDVRNGVVSSWFVLHEPEFSDFEAHGESDLPLLVQPSYEVKQIKRWFRKPLTQNFKQVNRIPNMFVRSSPVVLGDAASRYMLQPAVIDLIRYGRRIQQSSPKRYFADTKPVLKQFWKMIPHDSSNAGPELAANVLYWLNENGEFVDRDKVRQSERPVRAPNQATYPHSTTLVWMLVAILERAWEQCNGGGNDLARFLQYSLRNVVVTYPSGWTCDEIALYRTRCQQAVEIFERSMFGTSGKISVDTRVDEAVASQMPYVFSEIHRLNDNAKNWLALTGKMRKTGQGVRIMNLDVGGGTSDVSVVEYRCTQEDGGDAVLEPTLLFRDGFAVAGDEMLRRIVCKVVIGSFDKNVKDKVKDRTVGDLIRDLFSGHSADSEQAPERSRHVKQCLIPLALQVIGDMTSLSPTRVIRNATFTAGIDPMAWRSFGAFICGCEENQVPGWWQSIGLTYDMADVSAIIRQGSMFGNCFRQIARLAVKYDVDVFFMSGKTSEMPDLKQMAREMLPLMPNRIVTARDYDAGGWYPFSDARNRISDAKSVTAVGAALHHMLHAGKIKGWRIKPLRVLSAKAIEWGKFEDLQNGEDGFHVREGGFHDLKLAVGTQIGKKLSLSDGEEPVYRFVNLGDSVDESVHQVRLTSKHDGMSEGLSLAAVDGKPAERSGYALVVDQLDPKEKEFWQDTGILFKE